MDQLSFSDAEYSGKRKQTRRERFLAEMEQVIPRRRLERLVEPHYPKALPLGHDVAHPSPAAVVRAQ